MKKHLFALLLVSAFIISGCVDGAGETSWTEDVSSEEEENCEKTTSGETSEEVLEATTPLVYAYSPIVSKDIAKTEEDQNFKRYYSDYHLNTCFKCEGKAFPLVPDSYNQFETFELFGHELIKYRMPSSEFVATEPILGSGCFYSPYIEDSSIGITINCYTNEVCSFVNKSSTEESDLFPYIDTTDKDATVEYILNIVKELFPDLDISDLELTVAPYHYILTKYINGVWLYDISATFHTTHPANATNLYRFVFLNNVSVVPDLTEEDYLEGAKARIEKCISDNNLNVTEIKNLEASNIFPGEYAAKLEKFVSLRTSKDGVYRIAFSVDYTLVYDDNKEEDFTTLFFYYYDENGDPIFTE